MSENANSMEVTENKNIKVITVREQNYTLQRVKPSAWLDILDRVAADKEHERRTMYAEILEHIVVQPKKKMDDFEDFGELEEVVREATRFQQGK